MTTTIKDAADDAGFIMALMALQGFNDKVYIKATPADEVYTKKAADTAFVKTLKLTDTLKTEVVKQPVVDAITASPDFTNKVYIKADKADEVYTKKAADTAFVKTLKLTDTLKTEVVKQPVVDAITASPDFTNKVYIKADEVYTKKAADTAFVKTLKLTDTLKTEVVKQPVVDAITASPDFTNKVYIKADKADEVYTKKAADTAFVKTLKLTDTLKTEVVKQPVVDAITASSDFTNKVYIKVAPADEVYTKKAADTAFVKTLELTDTLKTEVVKQPVVDAITASPDFTNKVYIKADKADEVYTKKAADTAFVKTLGLTDTLKTEVVKQPVVDAITASPDFTNKVYIKADKADEVYTKKAADTAFVKAKELATKVAEKAVMDAIFDAKDGNKSILVDKLGEFLIKDDTKAYDNGKKTAKELLVPSAADLVQNQSFKKDIDTSIKEMAVSSNSDFQKSVREVMSQPSFEIPTSDDAALNWTW